MSVCRCLLLIILVPLCLVAFNTGSCNSAEAEVEAGLSSSIIDGGSLATEISKAVGVSISPLLGMTSLGAYKYYKTPDTNRDHLPWYNQPIFWGPLFIVLLAIAAKDSVKTVLPIPKQILIPLDALEALENKVSGLLAVPVIISSITSLESGNIDELLNSVSLQFSSVAYAASSAGQAGGDIFSVIKLTLIAIVVVFCCAMVWLVSHAINVLILLSPFSTIDFLLKMIRNGVVFVLLAASLINPYLGLLVALAIIVVAYFLAGWSFRFMIFGTVFSYDMLLNRGCKNSDQEGEVSSFSCRDLDGVPAMSYGKISQSSDSFLEFRYRPWLLLPQRVVKTKQLGEELELGIGTFSPIVLYLQDEDNPYKQLFRLRGVYKKREQYVLEALGLKDVRDVSIGRGLKEAFSWMVDQFKPKKKYDHT